MSHVSASFSATIRVRLADAPGSFARLAEAIGDAGGSLGAIDLVRVEKGIKIRDVTVDASDADHLARIVERVRAVDGVEVERVSDRTFLMHLGGKIEMRSKVPVKTRDDLSMAYTPGVARVCMADRTTTASSAWNLTIKQNTVAVVSDGTAVLGLGDIGPEAAMPVMEGKAMLFKEFGGVDAWPLCLDTKDVDEIVAIVKAIAPGFGGINLEDISAPRCFEIERRLRAELDIPVFHDDQHGTAIVVLAALLNALRVVGKRIEDDQGRDDRRRRGRRRGDRHPAQRGRPRRRSAATTAAPIYDGRDGPERRQAGVRRAHEPASGSQGSADDVARGRRRLHRPLGAGRGLARRRSSGWPTTRSSSRWPTRRPRSRPRSCRRARSRSSRPAARTTRTRSTTCSPSPASSAARSTSARARSTRR